MTEIDISKLDKSEVLRCLYNSSLPLGMGILHYTPEEMTHEQATELLREGAYFDYIKGRVMKIDLRGETLDTRLYDRDNGPCAAYSALRHLIEGTSDVSA